MCKHHAHTSHRDTKHHAPPSDCSPPLTAHDLDPCLDPTLHDQRTNLDPDTAEYGQSYPDGHDDVTTGAA